MRLLLPLVLAVSLVAPVRAAINPAEFIRHAPEQLRLREVARVVQETEVDGARLRRVTLVGEVVEQWNSTADYQGQTIVIDYTVDLSARERGARAHSEANGNRPGPQYMQEPDPPTPGADGTYWANLAAVGSDSARDHREAGAVAATGGGEVSGAVFVPVAGQYSFDDPR